MITEKEFDNVANVILAKNMEENRRRGIRKEGLVFTGISMVCAIDNAKKEIFKNEKTTYCVVCGEEIPEEKKVCGDCGERERGEEKRLTARQRENCIFLKEHLGPLITECDLSVTGMEYGITEEGEEHCIIFRSGKQRKIVDITGSSFTKMALDVLNGIK